MKRTMTGFAVIASVMLAFGDAEPVRWSGELVKEIPCVSAGQNNFDFEIPFSLTGCWGISFVPELPAEQILQIDEAFFFFRTGPSSKATGWYGKPFFPVHPSERMFFAFGDGWLTQLKPEGWDKVTGIRVAICLRSRDKPPFSTLKLALKDMKLHAVEPDEVREAKASMPKKVLAYPPVAGERHFAWMNDLLSIRGRFDWEPFIRRAAEDGITDLIPLVATSEKAVYRSKVLPMDEKDLAVNGDQLEFAKETCHKYGIKLHTWKVNWSCSSEKAPAVVQYRSEGRLGKRWRGWKDKDSKIGDTLWLCPSDERNRKLEFDAMLELAGKGVDGIHFDYIRFDRRRTCYCDRCRALFENRIGRPVANWPKDCAYVDGPLAAQWDEFRRDTISELVRRVASEVRIRYPKVEISAAVTTFHEDCASDWPRWCREKWLDFVCPMTYTMSMRQLEGWIDFDAKVQAETGIPVYPGIGVFSSCSQLDALACAQQLDLIRRRGFRGFAFFKICSQSFPTFDMLGKGPLTKQREVK